MASSRVDRFITNSRVVADRIKKYYGREAKVIYPPVETDKFYISPKLGNYFLIGGRLVAYKRYDLAIKAFNKLGIKLKIFGTGPEMERLERKAGSNIEFLGEVSDRRKARLYSECQAFIHPQIEDFGITAVEAMASGRPVIAYFDGGAKETVIPHQTGEFFEEQIWESLANRIIDFDVNKYSPAAIKKHAERFSSTRFQEEIQRYVEDEWNEFRLQRIFRIKR